MEVLRTVVSTVYRHSHLIDFSNVSKLLRITAAHNRVKTACPIYTSSVRCSLSEFFDEDNSDLDNVAVGRPWRKSELRIKSNQDLHKLWYVLLKERNMLMTMEHMCTTNLESVPNPERIDKVEESMENILDVVKERNVAYELLEYGETTEPKKYVTRNVVGLPYERTPKEHYIPKHLNERHTTMHPKYQGWMKKYLAQYEEKFRRQRNYKNKMHQKERKELIKEFEMDEDEIPEYADNTDDKLDEFLKQTSKLNNVNKEGR